ncbi:MAG: DUF3089 domain-containing protein [Deltaproteobacteria bacterium]|nr:DUF3089 domain-containing protein [Deltaproteobacteria bacterium]
MKCNYRVAWVVWAFFLFFLVGTKAWPCSEVFVGSAPKARVSARNFDFRSGRGFVHFSPAGEKKSAQYAPKGCRPLPWVSRYAAVSFNSFLPQARSPEGGFYSAGVDGVNVAGLKIGTYFLASSSFPGKGPATAIDVASLGQYLLDSFQSVGEALADLKSGRFQVTSLPTETLAIKLHLFLHDASGASAVVEFLGGSIKITENPPIPVLTNSVYSESLDHLKNYKGFGGKRDIPGANGSLDRFVRGAFYRKQLPEPADAAQAVNFGFAAAQTLAVPPEFPHGCTQWTIVTDILGRRVYFRTLNNPTVASINLPAVAEAARVSSDIDLWRTDLSGDISGLFSRSADFSAAAVPRRPEYDNPENWAELPPAGGEKKPVDVFFVHPTAFFESEVWNESIESGLKNPRIDFSLKKCASAFRKSCNIFAPHYREAHMKVLRASEANKEKAMAVAYEDVERAFDNYLRHFNQGRPFILAGHSQGSNLLLMLLEGRFADARLREQLVASYLIGWSVTTDDLRRYPFLKMSAARDQIGCLVSYNTQSEKPAMTIVRPGAVGVNPLTMDLTDRFVPAEKNLGALFVTDSAEIEIPAFTGAQTVNGALVIPEPSRKDLVRTPFRGFYHPYDYSIFYRNIERNVAERVAAFLRRRQGGN